MTEHFHEVSYRKQPIVSTDFARTICESADKFIVSDSYE